MISLWLLIRIAICSKDLPIQQYPNILQMLLKKAMTLILSSFLVCFKIAVDCCNSKSRLLKKEIQLLLLLEKDSQKEWERERERNWNDIQLQALNHIFAIIHWFQQLK